MIRVTSTGSIQPEVPRKGLGTMTAYRLLQDFASPSLIDQGENISIEHDTVPTEEPNPPIVVGSPKRHQTMSGKMKTLLKEKVMNQKSSNTSATESAMFDKDNFVAPKGEVVVSFATLSINTQSHEGSWFLCMKLSTDETQKGHHTGYIPSQFLEKLSHDEFVTYLKTLSGTPNDFGMSTMNRSQNIERQLRASTLGLPVSFDSSYSNNLNIRKLIVHKNKRVVKKLLSAAKHGTTSTQQQAEFGRKRSIETNLPWHDGVKYFKEGNYIMALNRFISKHGAFNSRVSFNIGITYFKLKQFESAIFYWTQAVTQDKFFSLAYFMRGVAYHSLGDPMQAIVDFTTSIQYCQNDFIDYAPLGLHFVLGRCEILFNRALCYLQLDEVDLCLKDLATARRMKFNNEHDKIEKLLVKVQEFKAQQPAITGGLM